MNTGLELIFKAQVLRKCLIDRDDMDKLTPEEFAMARRNGLGASDMSAVLGTMNKFRTRDDVLQNKLQTVWTEEEQAVSEKVNVRKGVDLEPMILKKAQEALGFFIVKPTEMFRFREYPWLTVNFDGVACDTQGNIVPVEAKFTSTYADKYWDYAEDKGAWIRPPYDDTLEYIEASAHCYGIPPYYLVQVQQQIMALEAPYGYVVSLRDKTWTLHTFKIAYDERIAQDIIVEGMRLWKQIEKIQRLTQP